MIEAWIYDNRLVLALQIGHKTVFGK